MFYNWLKPKGQDTAVLHAVFKVWFMVYLWLTLHLIWNISVITIHQSNSCIVAKRRRPSFLCQLLKLSVTLLYWCASTHFTLLKLYSMWHSLVESIPKVSHDSTKNTATNEWWNIIIVAPSRHKAVEPEQWVLLYLFYLWITPFEYMFKCIIFPEPSLKEIWIWLHRQMPNWLQCLPCQ